jgi:L-iditol 2-dehydrogenase
LNQHPFKDNVNRVTDILAAVMPAPRAPIELRSFPRPDLPPGAALLRTERSEVCGTDVHLWHGRLSGVPYPIIPGHVSAGVIDAARGPLAGIDGSPIAEGDRVVFFDVHRTCGRCRACTVHRTPTRCAARRVYGITDSADEGLFGGWAQAIYLEPGVALARLPSRVALDDYIGGGCGLLTAVHIIERAEIRLGDVVVVQGTGAVGLCTIALAKLAGAAQVVAIGAPGDRLALAIRMGADVAIDLRMIRTPAERVDLAASITNGEGADVVIEAAGAPEAIAEGLDHARVGGRYVIAGHYTDVGDTAINAHRQINRKHLEIRGCWGSEPRHFLRAISVLERHPEIPFREIGAKTYGLAALNDALADAEAMRIPKALVDPFA